MKITGFAKLKGADPRCVFVDADAGVHHAGYDFAATIASMSAGGAGAVAFNVVESSYTLDRLVRGGALTAQAETRDENGLVIVTSVRLVDRGWDGPTNCWPADLPMGALDNESKQLLVRAQVAVQGALFNPVLRPVGRPTSRAGTAEISITGDIGSADHLVSRIGALAPLNLMVDIDSPGGSAEEGLRLYDCLARHPHQVTVRIVSAQSIAALIALAGDYRTIAPDGQMMLHQPHVATPFTAEAAVLRSVAAAMDRMTERFVSIVAARTGQDWQTVQGWVNDATSFNAGEAITADLAHAVDLDIVPTATTKPRATFRAVNGPYRSTRVKRHA